MSSIAFQSGMTLLQGEESVAVILALALVAGLVLRAVATPREHAKKR